MVTEADFERLHRAMLNCMISSYRNRNAPNVVEHAGADRDATATKLPAQHDSSNSHAVVLIRPNRDGGTFGN